MKYTVYEVGEMAGEETRQDLGTYDHITPALTDMLEAAHPDDGDLAKGWCHKVVMEITNG